MKGETREVDGVTWEGDEMGWWLPLGSTLKLAVFRRCADEFWLFESGQGIGSFDTLDQALAAGVKKLKELEP